MSSRRIPPAWRLPEGVSPSLWEYTHTPRLAAEEEAYFAGHPLFEADVRALDERLLRPGRLIDLGCGVGRHSLHFASRGFDVVAVDLSRPMLGLVNRKAEDSTLSILTLEANLCRLRCLPDSSFDYAISMFSTLGMIRGRESRRKALKEASRVLKPGGRLALHAHNLWLNARNPQGRRWLVSQMGRRLLGRDDAGDRRMTYRGIHGMEVHLYRWSELRRALNSAGFRIDESIPLNEISAQPIPKPRFLPSLRAGGWLVFATRR